MTCMKSCCKPGRDVKEAAERIVSTVFNNLDRQREWTTPRSTIEYLVAVMLFDLVEEMGR